MRNLPGMGMKRSRAGVVIGMGMGGFVDGIVLHQIVHWHNMGSAVLPPATMEAMERNMVWDGLFHAGTWLVTFAGVWMLFAHAHAHPHGRALPTGRGFAGQMLMGWGLFNLVEGAIDHHLLNLHHVRDLPVHVPLYDWVFLAVGGVGFIVVGWLLSRTRPRWGV